QPRNRAPAAQDIKTHQGKPSPSSGRKSASVLRHSKNLVDGNALERLRLPAWPVDFHSRLPRPTKSEMQPLIVRRTIAARGAGVAGLPTQPHLGAKAVSVAPRPDQGKHAPMVPIGTIPQDYRPTSPTATTTST